MGRAVEFALAILAYQVALTDATLRHPQTLAVPLTRTQWNCGHPQQSLLQLRGGSASVDVRDYLLQQQLNLQMRSILLRQALVERGLTAMQPSANDDEAPRKPTDWDCALASPSSPKSCLYSFDAEAGSKVVAPSETTEWITLSSLNRLRRTDPSKIEPLWHSKYAILSTWFNPRSRYSLYAYLSPTASFLSFWLDSPILFSLALASLSFALFIMTSPIWNAVTTAFMTSDLFWSRWQVWARIVHAGLPLKLFVGDLLLKNVFGVVLADFYGRLRTKLIDWECSLWESCIPLTVLERNDDSQRVEETRSYDADSMEDEDEEIDEEEDE